MNFSKYCDFEDEHKNNNNGQLVEMSKKHFPKTYERIKYLVLDGKNMFTTKTLMANDIPSRNIIVVERDEETYDEMKKRKINEIYHDDLENYIINHDIPDVCVVFFDFMNHVEGSKRKKDFPLETLNTFLQKTNQEKLVLAFTFSLRGGPGKKLKRHKTAIEAIEEFLLNNFTFNQFEIIDQITPITYCRSADGKRGTVMGFFIYAIQKNENIDSPSAIFYREKGKHLIEYDYYMTEEDVQLTNAMKKMKR